MSAPRDPDVIVAAWLETARRNFRLRPAVRSRPPSGRPPSRGRAPACPRGGHRCPVPRPRRSRRGGRGGGRRVCDPHASAHRQPRRAREPSNVCPARHHDGPGVALGRAGYRVAPGRPDRPHRVLEGHWWRRGHRRQARRMASVPERSSRCRATTSNPPGRATTRRSPGPQKTASGLSTPMAPAVAGLPIKRQRTATRSGRRTTRSSCSIVVATATSALYPGRRWRRPEAADQQRRR